MKKLLGTIEQKLIIGVLEILNGNKSKTSRRLGITRATLDHKLSQYGREDLYRKIKIDSVNKTGVINTY